MNVLVKYLIIILCVHVVAFHHCSYSIQYVDDILLLIPSIVGIQNRLGKCSQAFNYCHLNLLQKNDTVLLGLLVKCSRLNYM